MADLKNTLNIALGIAAGILVAEVATGAIRRITATQRPDFFVPGFNIHSGRGLTVPKVVPVVSPAII